MKSLFGCARYLAGSRLAVVSLVAGLLFAGCAHTQQAQSIRVYKYTGSIQCEAGGVSLEAMQHQLARAGIEVICSQQAGDGRAYPAMCGAATGRINVYTIAGADLDRAGALGFKPVETLPEARIPACE
ncbi:MAG: hypothetical protein ABR578_09855 [Chromatocurvus sp.]